MTNKPKTPNLISCVREKIETGSIRYSAHALIRMVERHLIKPEIEFVLKNGRHNKRKDQFNGEHLDWDYAVEGRTVDGRKLRIIVAIVSSDLLVVTAIDLGAEN